MSINTIPLGLLLIICCLGAFICRSIIFYLITKESPLVSKFCKIKGVNNCDTVLDSRFGRVSKNITLADIGFVYFSSVGMFILNSVAIGVSQYTFLVLTLPFVLACLLSFASLFYQWHLKSWCKLCLGIIGIVWLQILILFIYLYNSNITVGNIKVIEVVTHAFLFIISLLFISIWFWIKPIFIKANELEIGRKVVRQLKENPKLFISLLKQQRTIRADTWENELQFGNKNAKIQIIVAINPYCKACGKDFLFLNHLLNISPDDIGFTLRFRFLPNSRINLPNSTVLYLINSYFSTEDPQEKLKRIRLWFQLMNLVEWRKRYPLITIKEGYEELTRKYQGWFEESNIVYTPTLFLNGYEFPKPFHISDLKILLADLISQQI